MGLGRKVPRIPLKGRVWLMGLIKMKRTEADAGGYWVREGRPGKFPHSLCGFLHPR